MKKSSLALFTFALIAMLFVGCANKGYVDVAGTKWVAIEIDSSLGYNLAEGHFVLKGNLNFDKDGTGIYYDSYGISGWALEQIAKDWGTTPDAVRRYYERENAEEFAEKISFIWKQDGKKVTITVEGYAPVEFNFDSETGSMLIGGAAFFGMPGNFGFIKE